jgi:TRAP-type transport system periplasmic protein
MSVASVNQAAYAALAPELQDAVDAAGSQTETDLWPALSIRLQQNHQRLRENGVTIDLNPAPALVAALQLGAADARQSWCTRSATACQKILGAFTADKP